MVKVSRSGRRRTEGERVALLNVFLGDSGPARLVVGRDIESNIRVAGVIAVQQIAVQFDVFVFAYLNGGVGHLVRVASMRQKLGDQLSFAERLQRYETRIVRAIVELNLDQCWMCWCMLSCSQRSVALAQMSSIYRSHLSNRRKVHKRSKKEARTHEHNSHVSGF